MNKWLGFALLSAYSLHGYAIENGGSVDGGNYDDIIKAYSSDEQYDCSGTIIGGQFVLTAAHCMADNTMKMAHINPPSTSIKIASFTSHPNYGDYNAPWKDVSILTLSTPADTFNIHFFANLNHDTVKEKDALRLFGFGGTEEQLHYADFTMTETGKNPIDRLDGLFIDKGNSTGGDSGGPWLNAKQEVVSVHKGSDVTAHADGTETRETYSTNLYYVNDFILEQINGWHYPTLANTSNETATITIQSLHQNPVTDSAYTSGDVQIVGGSCFDGQPVITAYEKCTYVIESQGGEGSLILGRSDEVIQINKPVPVSGGSDGGSFGLLGLLSLLGFSFYRKKQTTV